ncbi:MAG TPA: AMP-binding protein, partial [Solirubrobacterales bacterium]|nr:AMP-binding protein [Solirubrobacterales bacterium]
MSTIGVLARSGLLKPAGPRSVARLAATLAAWGATPAAGYASAAALTPDRAALIDEAGSLTFREVESRTNALARLLSAEGVDESSQIGILARNHRGFAEATVAAWKLGAGVVFLNTSFAGPQLRDAARGEGISLVIHDAEFAEQVS